MLSWPWPARWLFSVLVDIQDRIPKPSVRFLEYLSRFKIEVRINELRLMPRSLHASLPPPKTNISSALGRPYLAVPAPLSAWYTYIRLPINAIQFVELGKCLVQNARLQ